MKQQDYNSGFVANCTAHEAIDKISQVDKWWGADVEGSSKNLNDVFTIHFGDTFVTFKIMELLPQKKVVWYVTDSFIPSLADKTEWSDTQVQFEVFAKDGATELSVTHVGLVPDVECYDMCSKGWDFFIKESLRKFIVEGKGEPNIPKLAR
ncbi:MAG: SRPBCC domain-containing protein [Bacteroidota bacterium]